MKIIDTHVHIWTHSHEFPWAQEVKNPPPYNAHPENLLKLMQDNSVERTVLVQYIGYRWDNSYTAHALKQYADRFMAVCRVDPENPAAPDDLSYWTDVHGFHGVRLSPAADSSGDWFADVKMIPLFERAANLKVPVLILTKPSRLKILAEILERVPDVDVVIDHMADCIDGNPHHLQILLDLVKYPRVYLKLSHIWANSVQPYPWTDTYTRIRQVCDIFGAHRIMWGSDWPLCQQKTSYTQALAFLRDEMHAFSERELAWILRDTALRLWPFSLSG